MSFLRRKFPEPVSRARQPRTHGADGDTERDCRLLIGEVAEDAERQDVLLTAREPANGGEQPSHCLLLGQLLSRIAGSTDESTELPDEPHQPPVATSAASLDVVRDRIEPREDRVLSVEDDTSALSPRLEEDVRGQILGK
jgi:hypothetical protein